MASKAAFFRSVLIRASARAAARARLPRSKTSLLRSSISKQGEKLIASISHSRRSKRACVRLLSPHRKQCSDSLARRDPRDDSGAPAVCDYCWDAGCGRKFYCIEFRDHAAHREPAFFRTNETSCVRDISDHRNPFAGMIHQPVNACKHDEQFCFCQHRDLGREAVVIPKAQLLHCHRIVLVNDWHDVLAFEQTPQCVFRILMAGATVQVAMREQKLRNVELMLCKHRGIEMHHL